MVHNIKGNNTSNNDNILLDDRHTSHSQLPTVIHKAQTGYVHLIADCLRHQQMLFPLLADTPTFPKIERFQLPTATGTEFRIIRWFLQTALISVQCASCYAHSLYKWWMHNIQTKTHIKCPTICNTQNAIFASILQCVCCNPIRSVSPVIPSGQNKDNSEASASSPKRNRNQQPDGSGSGSQVVVVAVHRNACCFDVCIPKLWIQSICQCGLISNRIYIRGVLSLVRTVYSVWYRRHTTFPISPNVYWNSVENCVVTSGTSVSQCYSVCRHLAQTSSWHVTSNYWVHKCTIQIIFFANTAMLEIQFDKYTIAQMM